MAALLALHFQPSLGPAPQGGSSRRASGNHQWLCLRLNYKLGRSREHLGEIGGMISRTGDRLRSLRVHGAGYRVLDSTLGLAKLFGRIDGISLPVTVIHHCDKSPRGDNNQGSFAPVVNRVRLPRAIRYCFSRTPCPTEGKIDGKEKRPGHQ